MRYLSLFLVLILVACQGNEIAQTAVPPTSPVTETVTLTASPEQPEVAHPLTPSPPHPLTLSPPPSTTAVATQPPPTPTPIPPDTPVPTAPVTHIQLAQMVRGGLDKPVYLTHAGDERLFVVEQDGRIRIVQNGQLLETPFLDIDSRVGSEANEQGLLSVAFHPHYAENGRFFVNYTNNEGNTVIGRYQVNSEDPNRADPDSEVVLLTIPQPYANHNGGQLQFGPDGYLYIGMGDGGSQGDPHNNGQNPNALLGSILRIDVDHEGNGFFYSIPPDNPFVNGGGAPEVWMIGFRNPWRFSFDRLTRDLYIADVGQNTWEEINFQPANIVGVQNYGWNLMEGAHCYNSNCDPSTLLLPIFEYSHAEGGCSITGGYVYRGQQYPSLAGNYFLADYCSGIIWSLFHQPDGTWAVNQVATVDFSISSFGEDIHGELYVLNHRGGRIFQVQP